MISLLIGGVISTAPIDTSALQIINEQKIELVAPEPEAPPEPPEPVITPEEQLELDIKNNVNNCDEALYWISAENATCLPKRVQTTNRTTTTRNTARGTIRASNGWYPYGQCTYYVWSRRPVGQWNNASEWLWQARRDGWATGSTPRVGAIAWEPGHVSLVTAVNGNTVTVSEMNWVGLGVVSTRTKPASSFQYIY